MGSQTTFEGIELHSTSTHKEVPMKKTLLLVAFLLACYCVTDAQVRLAAKYNYPLLPGTPSDSVLNGLKSIRGCAFALDVDGDNRSEIAVTNYSGTGRVCLFEAVGNDSIALKWTSPPLLAGTGTANVTPRFVVFGDLDNDGKKEIITQIGAQGIYIFEWDGVVGSNNYGTQPSQIINLSFLAGTAGNCEYMEVGDIDGDGQQELLVAYNSTPDANDKYYVIAAVGEWDTNDPGFSSFNVEYSYGKTTAGASAYGLAVGSPGAMIAANLDGTGNKEILLHNYNQKNIVAPIRVTAANTYILPDTNTLKQHIYLTPLLDQAAFFGGLAYDIDGDGREEVYLPTFAFDGSSPAGIVHMISYNTGQSTTTIDSTNVTRLSVAGLATTTFGFGYGDINNNGKKEIYLSSTYGASASNVVALEFQGGDKRNPANWIPRVVYRGDSTIFADELGTGGVFISPAFIYKDSLGVRDTLVSRRDNSFASKFHGRFTDFDADGREDIILPYQALQDSFTVWDLTWNVGNGKYDTVATKHVNPKRWGLRVIERDPSIGVEIKDLTIITPDDYRLEQNYPNPFNPSTTIKFFLPIKDRISVKVFDVLGQEVRTLINNEDHPAGVGQVVWDGKNNAGIPVTSGAYFYTLKFGNFEKTNKMLLLK